MTDQPAPQTAIGAALLEAQKKFGKIKKKREAQIVTTKGTYHYNYADLPDVLEAVMPALHENGIFLTQPTRIEWGPDGQAGLVLSTILHHPESGETISCEWPIAMQQQAQQTGSLLSYFRRYALCSLLGISAEEETDKTEQDTLPQTQGNKPVRGRGKGKGKQHSGQVPTQTKYTKGEIQQFTRDFRRDIMACSDQDELDALVASNDEMIAAVQTDLSEWWYGSDRNPDYEPFPALIARRSNEFLEVKEQAEPGKLV